MDRWIEFWGEVFRALVQKTKFIKADLSGGFDSRIAFLVILNSGIDLNKIRITSIKSDLHTYAEDYAIATQIANHYGFKLNQERPVSKFLNYSFHDLWNLDFYTRHAFHKSTLFLKNTKRLFDKSYSVGGFAGESIREYKEIRLHSSSKYIEEQKQKTRPYSPALADELFNSTKKILQVLFRAICDKYDIKDSDSDSHALPYFYLETRSKSHFGKTMLNEYFKGIRQFSPIIDPELRTLKLCTSEYPDLNLLLALIFTRYEPDLLSFPFDSGHSIVPETIEYAKKINERFPRRVTTDKVDGGGVFYLQPRDLQAEKILASGKNNSAIPASLPQSYLKAVFESSKTFGLFTSYFDLELYNYAASYFTKHRFQPDLHMYSVVSIAKVIEDVETSQRKQSFYMQRFLEQDFAKVHEDEINIPFEFQRYLTARIDIKLTTPMGDFQIFSVSDKKARVAKPDWYQKDGIGYVIQSYAGHLNFSAKTNVAGKIILRLMGIDMRDPKNRTKCIPYWVDYTKLTVNDKTILDTLTPAWHNKPYYYHFDIKAGQEVTIKIEWLPHRSDT